MQLVGFFSERSVSINEQMVKPIDLSRTTAYTCTAEVDLLSNQLFNEKGVFPPDLIGKHPQCFDFILKYLESRNVVYQKIVHV